MDDFSASIITDFSCGEVKLRGVAVRQGEHKDEILPDSSNAIGVLGSSKLSTLVAEVLQKLIYSVSNSKVTLGGVKLAEPSLIGFRPIMRLITWVSISWRVLVRGISNRFYH